MSAPTVLCLYRVTPGREDEFTGLLRRHWPTLRSLDLVTDDRPQHYRGEEPGGGPLFVEIFRWKSEEASGLAHEHPEVMAIWEPMDKLTERRDGRPNMEFPHVQPLAVLD
jgi:hypothetical protein